MINFIIVDDNKLHIKTISNIIIKRMMSNKIEFNTYEFSSYNNKLRELIRSKSKDRVYILSLESNGIDIARDIRNRYEDWNSPIIIVNGKKSLYFEVYNQRLQILDFISKKNDLEKVLFENIDICLKMLNKEKVYRYTYKNIDYTINLNHVDYIQREGRKIKIVTKDKEYYQNISVSKIKDDLPSYFVTSSKGILINLKNVYKIDWSKLIVFFMDNTNGYLVSKSHKKEIDAYEF